MPPGEPTHSSVQARYVASVIAVVVRPTARIKPPGTTDNIRPPRYWPPRAAPIAIDCAYRSTGIAMASTPPKVML